MKKSTKALLGIGATALVGTAAAYGTATLIGELLFNKKMILPSSLNAKISGCDMSHLGEILRANLQWVEDYGYEKHYITTDRGEKLTGYLMKSKTESDIYVFGAHGYRSYGKKEFCGFAQYYLNRGVNIFFPDHIASGESEGTHCTFGYYETEDCLKWLEYMTENFGKEIKIILHGVSMGSAIVCMLSGRSDLPKNVKMTVADCGFTTAGELYTSKLSAMGVGHSVAEVLIKGSDKANEINHKFSILSSKPVESVKSARVPMFFVHGTGDNLVPSYMATELYENCGSENKYILLVEGADHAQAHLVGKEEYEARLDEMIERFVG